MKKVFAIALGALIYLNSYGQKAYLEDPDNFDPTKPCKIMVNLNNTDNEWGIIEAAAGGEDMYIWTWSPAEHEAGHPLSNGTGSQAWKSSNEALKMTKEDDGIYSYVLTPTEFYEVDAAIVYDKDIKLLVKPKDGGGYGDPDVKTEDLVIIVDPPVGPVAKIEVFPAPYLEDTLLIKQDDVFTITYNNTVEEKVSMQGVTDLYLYAQAFDENETRYSLASNAKRVGDFPQLQMQNLGNGIFRKGIVPERFFTIPDGVNIVRMEFIIVKPNLVNSDDTVEEQLIYYMNTGNCP